MNFWITDGVLHEENGWLHKDEGVVITVSDDSEEFVIPDGVTSFDFGAFSKMPNLKHDHSVI